MPQNPNIPNPQQFEPSMLSGLKKAWQGATAPNWSPSQQLLDANTKQVNEAAPFQQEPSLDPNMVLDQLSQQTSGIGLGALAAGPVAKGVSWLARGAEALPEAIQGLRGATQGALQGARVTRGMVPAAETLGEVDPMFTPATEAGMDMYNASKRNMNGVVAPPAISEASRDAWALRNGQMKPPIGPSGPVVDRSVGAVGGLRQALPGSLADVPEMLRQRGRVR